MKRFHVNVGVRDLQRSLAFYSDLFGIGPTVQEADYAKWMLDDPRVNFAISTRVDPGVDHVGIQAEDDSELTQLRGRLAAAEMAVIEQPDVVCCYARGSKSWVRDPDGLAWETFLTHGPASGYGGESPRERSPSACCAPADVTSGQSTCCGP